MVTFRLDPGKEAIPSVQFMSVAALNFDGDTVGEQRPPAVVAYADDVHIAASTLFTETPRNVFDGATVTVDSRSGFTGVVMAVREAESSLNNTF